MANRLSKYVSKINKMPKFCQSFLLTKLFCSQVKYANTSNITLLEINNNHAKLIVENKKRVQNHIGGVHAVAVALLAESATGIAFGINVPDSCLPLLKSMTIDYKKRMQGDISAVAKISDEQIKQIQSNDKGDMIIDVEIFDESDESPVVCHMHWAWVTKKARS